MTIAAQHVRAGLKHLRRDPVMKRVIKQVGPFTLKPRRDRFYTLARGIVGQQISTSAAETIFGRLLELLEPEPLSAEAIGQHSIESLSVAGVSKQKASYLLDLAHHLEAGSVELGSIHRLSDQQVVDHLTQVKGIGPWSAKMFLIFSLGRLDVMAGEDLGIRNAIHKNYELAEVPSPKEAMEMAEAWSPYRTLASWYLWQSLDLGREK